MSEREPETTQEESQHADPDEGEGEPSRSQPTTTSEPRAEERVPLFPSDEAERYRRRWEDLQAGFVDRPREMVEEADDLVGQLMQQLTAGFDNERSSLEAQWEKGEDVSTEELRVALTRYRSFFNRLLSA